MPCQDRDIEVLAEDFRVYLDSFSGRGLAYCFEQKTEDMCAYILCLIWLQKQYEQKKLHLGQVSRLMIFWREYFQRLKIGDRVSVGRLCSDLDRVCSKLAQLDNPALCSRVIWYVETQHEDMNLKSMAEKLKTNSSYLSRIISQNFGCTFLELLHCHRIMVSFALFAVSKQELSMEEISSRLGYSSVHYYYNVFKRYAGLTPSKTRRIVYSIL